MTTNARWFGQSAFLISAEKSVLIDPFGVPGDALAARGLEFGYPPVEGVEPDLVLITHEQSDHNAAEVAGGDPVVLRSTAGRLESPVGEVVAIASEHDDQAGTARGPNTIFCFTLGGLRLCHMGRARDRPAAGRADALPHRRGELLEPPDAFLEALGAEVVEAGRLEIELDGALGTREAPKVALLARPRGRVCVSCCRSGRGRSGCTAWAPPSRPGSAPSPGRWTPSRR